MHLNQPPATRFHDGEEHRHAAAVEWPNRLLALIDDDVDRRSSTSIRILIVFERTGEG